MRRQAPEIPVYGERNPGGHFQGVHIPRAGEPATGGGYTQYGGAPNKRPSRISTTNPPIMLVNEYGIPIHVDWCVEGCTLLNIIKIFLAEVAGTLILMFFGCSGIMFNWLSFGAATAAAVQIFGHISGAHINPAMTFASLIMGNISLVMVPFYLTAQCLGAIIGYGLHYVVYEVTDASQECIISPLAGIEKVQDNEAIAFGREFLMTLIYIMAVCSLWDRERQDGYDVAAPLKRGLLYSGLVFCAPKALSLNPFRASIPLIWASQFYSVAHWIYWVAPLVASVAGTCIYRGLAAMSRKVEKKDY